MGTFSGHRAHAKGLKIPIDTIETMVDLKATAYYLEEQRSRPLQWDLIVGKDMT